MAGVERTLLEKNFDMYGKDKMCELFMMMDLYGDKRIDDAWREFLLSMKRITKGTKYISISIRTYPTRTRTYFDENNEKLRTDHVEPYDIKCITFKNGKNMEVLGVYFDKEAMERIIESL